jgi:hypothetical protein
MCPGEKAENSEENTKTDHSRIPLSLPPNAAPQPHPEAEAQRTLEGVGCRRLFGQGHYFLSDLPFSGKGIIGAPAGNGCIMDLLPTSAQRFQLVPQLIISFES